MKTVVTERLTIRRLEVGDAEELIRYHALPEVSRYQGWEPKTVEEVGEFVAQMERCGFLAGGQWFQFAIVLTESGELVGDCGVCAGSDESRQVEVGISLVPEFQGKGLAQEGLRGVLGYLFEATSCHRVHASVDPRNVASVRLFERLGFRKEAHLVESLCFKGEWVDDVVFAMLGREWLGGNGDGD